MADVTGAGNGGSVDQMKQAMSIAQDAQAEITAETIKHQTVMKTLEAMKNAFQAIKA